MAQRSKALIIGERCSAGYIDLRKFWLSEPNKKQIVPRICPNDLVSLGFKDDKWIKNSPLDETTDVVFRHKNSHRFQCVTLQILSILWVIHRCPYFLPILRVLSLQLGVAMKTTIEKYGAAPGP